MTTRRYDGDKTLRSDNMSEMVYWYSVTVSL